MLVDVHCHYLPTKAVEGLPGIEIKPPSAGEDGSVLENGKRLGPLPAGLSDLAAALEDSDRSGVDVRVLCAPAGCMLTGWSRGWVWATHAG